jgi:hypothetical protein
LQEGFIVCKLAFGFYIWLFLPLCALAADTIDSGDDRPYRLYVGAGPSISRACDCSIYSSDERGSFELGYVANAGFRISRFLAIELGYLDTGELGIDVKEDFALGPASRVSADVDLTAVQLTGLLIWPLPKRAEIYGKAGFSFWDADSDQVFSPGDGGAAIRRSVSDSGADFLVGIGVGLSFGERWHARLEAQTFDIASDLVEAEPINASPGVESVLLEIHYRFGDDWPQERKE